MVSLPHGRLPPLFLYLLRRHRSTSYLIIKCLNQFDIFQCEEWSIPFGRSETDASQSECKTLVYLSELWMCETKHRPLFEFIEWKIQCAGHLMRVFDCFQNWCVSITDQIIAFQRPFHQYQIRCAKWCLAVALNDESHFRTLFDAYTHFVGLSLFIWYIWVNTESIVVFSFFSVISKCSHCDHLMNDGYFWYAINVSLA